MSFSIFHFPFSIFQIKRWWKSLFSKQYPLLWFQIPFFSSIWGNFVNESFSAWDFTEILLNGGKSSEKTQDNRKMCSFYHDKKNADGFSYCCLLLSFLLAFTFGLLYSFAVSFYSRAVSFHSHSTQNRTKWNRTGKATRKAFKWEKRRAI